MMYGSNIQAVSWCLRSEGSGTSSGGEIGTSEPCRREKSSNNMDSKAEEGYFVRIYICIDGPLVKSPETQVHIVVSQLWFYQ
jgi:hypothetical protein